MTVLDSAQELIDQANPRLCNIYAHTLSISLRPNGPDESIEPNARKMETHFMNMRAQDRLLYRLRIDLSTREYEAVADYVAEYEVPGSVELSDFAIADFFDRCVHATLYPYVRAALANLTAQLPVEMETLPIFIPGSVVFAER